MTLCLGRLPGHKPVALGYLSDYVRGRLPAPPPSVGYGHLVSDFPMDGNDQYGDCTLAAAAHLLQLWNAEVQEADPVPSEQDVVSEYYALTGGPDTGLVEAEVLKHWYTTGLWGNKIAGYAPVAPSSISAIHQAVAFYGACYLGVLVTAEDQQRFADGQPWVPSNSQVLGGHAIPIAGYDPEGVWVVTWGKLQRATYPWLERALEEAWCILPSQYKQRGHGPKDIAWADLASDLARV